MDTQTVTLFLALLAVAAEAAVLVAVVLALGGRWSPAVRRARERVVAEVAPQALGLGAAVAAVCTAGSLYLSEVAHFPPCRLCWLQRGAMYPQVVLLGVAALWPARRAILRAVSAVVVALGACVSVWHLLVERYPNLETSSCDPANPCSIIWVERFGYLTIPAMALSGFALIGVLLAAAGPTAPSTTAPQEAS
jgi:disulfide bond formation protein DsbB